MRFAPGQLESSPLDNEEVRYAETTDEAMMRIALKKKTLNESVLKLMRGAAIDCMLFKKSFGSAASSCLDEKKGPVADGDLLCDVDFKTDALTDECAAPQPNPSSARKKPSSASLDVHEYRKCKVNGTHYAVDMTTKEVYDLAAYTEERKLKKIGQLIVSANANAASATSRYKFFKLQDNS
jgi:hypothetical protein